jgi:hypothetical protein
LDVVSNPVVAMVEATGDVDRMGVRDRLGEADEIELTQPLPTVNRGITRV